MAPFRAARSTFATEPAETPSAFPTAAAFMPGFAAFKATIAARNSSEMGSPLKSHRYNYTELQGICLVCLIGSPTASIDAPKKVAPAS
jgi:hypothetical protein